MKGPLTTWLLRILALAGAVVVCCAESGIAGQTRHGFQGRSLAEALSILQRDGLRIVFSSEIVTPDLRVVSEPVGTSPIAQLDELLEPHGLEAKRGPHSIIQIVRSRSTSRTRTMSAVPRAPAKSAPVDPLRADDGFAEQVLVKGSIENRADPGVVSQATLDADDIQAARSVLQDDPLQIVQTLPGVAASDDFRSEFSVRGSPYRHIGVVIDGVATPWLQHSVYRHSDAGSLSMFGSDIIEAATLQAGAYPRRYDDMLGAQLALTLRQGSREARRVRASFGGTMAGVVAEGPLGRLKRGSWIVGARNSYLTWPVNRRAENALAFGFGDAHAKLVYDVTPTQQITFTTLGGRSALDWKQEPVGSELSDGTSRAAFANLGWRTTLGGRTVIRQQASMVDQTFANRTSAGQNAGRATNQALFYQAVILHAVFGGILEAGGDLRHLRGTRHAGADTAETFGAGWWTRSAYVHFARNIAPHLSVAEGIRASDSTLIHAHSVSPWILSAWSFKPRWRLSASLAVSHQFPELEEIWSMPGSPVLAPERATHRDVGIEQRLARGFRWHATFFNRAERNVLRLPDVNPRLVDGLVIDSAASPSSYANALSGTARGVEVLVAREDASRLTGWISYSYATVRQSDGISHETYWADFDRRHSYNIAGVVRASNRTSIGIVLRGGTNAPIPGYFEARSGSLFVGERRNEVRLPFYSRLDARAQHAFDSRGRITVFAEMLNVTNRQNQGPADGHILWSTGEAVGFTRPLLSRRASAGIAAAW